MSNNKTSIKFSDNCLNFLNNVRLNRIKVGGDEMKSYDESLELVVKFFKDNNDEYIQMLRYNMEEMK